MTQTFLLVQLSSEGSPFSEIADVLESLGFRPEGDGYDFVYDWDRTVSVRETLELADKVQAALKGMHVAFRLESTEE